MDVDALLQDLQETSKITVLNSDFYFKLRMFPTWIPLTFGPQGAMLYLSGRSVLNSYKEYGFDHLVSMMNTCPIERLEDSATSKASNPEFKHEIIDIEDSSDEENVKKMKACLTSVLPSIHESIINGKRVCVHCKAGVSRSATVVIAYLMKYEKMNWHEAIQRVRELRPIICPNKGFLQILKEFDV
jgi:protein-tyrosine phosphatase